jgi:hypothetical protein
VTMNDQSRIDDVAPPKVAIDISPEPWWRVGCEPVELIDEWDSDPLWRTFHTTWRWWTRRPARPSHALYPETVRRRNPSPLLARHRQRRRR